MFAEIGLTILYCPILILSSTANLRTKILDFRGFGSSRIVILRVEIPRPIGSLPESLSQAILAGIILVGRLGVEREDYCSDACPS